MILSHYHDGAAPTPRSVTQTAKAHFKPSGFWLSDESPNQHSWSIWCRDNNFKIGENRTDFEVEMSNVLHIKTSEELRIFDTKFGRDNYRADWHVLPLMNYKGIVISPYQWGLRFDISWYYTWDCACACIWDVSCLTKVT